MLNVEWEMRIGISGLEMGNLELEMEWEMESK